jgi:hypothetical protein
VPLAEYLEADREIGASQHAAEVCVSFVEATIEFYYLYVWSKNDSRLPINIYKKVVVGARLFLLFPLQYSSQVHLT